MSKYCLSDDDIRNYHIGMSFEDAWRAYAGMVETKEAELERVISLVPDDIGSELLSYFKRIQNGLDGDYE